MAEGVRDDPNVCHLCGAFEHLSLCSRCRQAWYCSKEHQKKHWKDHKQTCKSSPKSNSCDSQSKNNTTDDITDIKSTRPSISRKASFPIGGDQGRSRSSPNPNMPSQDDKQVSDLDTENIDLELDLKFRDIIMENRTNEKETCHNNHKDLDIDNSTINARSKSRESSKSNTNMMNSDQNCRTTARLAKSNASQLSRDEHEKSQMAKSKSTATTTTGSVSQTTNLKNRHKTKPNNALTQADDTLLQERYYLNQETHTINLPSSTHGIDSSYSLTMGQCQGDANTLNAAQTREQYLLILQSRFEEVSKYVVKCLTRFGICVLDQFLGEFTGQEILNEVLNLDQRGIMKQGQLVHGPTSSKNKRIRGDKITWINGTEQSCENIHFLISCMDAVILQSSSSLKSCQLNERTKAMVACYPGEGTGYLRHVDNPNGDGRCVTCIYYINKDWDAKKNGGLLCIYPEGSDQVARIEPKFDRLLFFWSDRRNPHEVEPAMQMRYAITVWYYDAEERAQALKKFKGSKNISSHKSQESSS